MRILNKSQNMNVDYSDGKVSSGAIINWNEMMNWKIISCISCSIREWSMISSDNIMHVKQKKAAGAVD